MVIADFNVVSIFTIEPEADAPLAIHRHRVLASTIALQGMKPVSWWNPHIAHRHRGIQHVQLPQRAPGNIHRELLRRTLAEELLGSFIDKRFYHSESVTHHVTHDNHELKRTRWFMANQVFREKNRVSRRAGCFRNIVYLGWIIKTCEFEQKAQDKALNLYIDTRGAGPRPVTFTEAVVDGLAAGGGLYVPERIPELTLEDIAALAQLPYAQRAARIYRAFDTDLPAETVDALMAQIYGSNFDDERICPITSLTADTHVLELWHGPTSAFKDMALQCLPRFFSASAAQLREQGKLDHDFLILVATSGDTGKAALEGFRDVDGVSIGVMYPDGGVSDIQFKQMATQRGRNVQVWGVRGNFDDCQTGAKNVFGDEAVSYTHLASSAAATFSSQTPTASSYCSVPV